LSELPSEWKRYQALLFFQSRSSFGKQQQHNCFCLLLLPCHDGEATSKSHHVSVCEPNGNMKASLDEVLKALTFSNEFSFFRSTMQTYLRSNKRSRVQNFSTQKGEQEDEHREEEEQVHESKRKGSIKQT